MVDIKELCNVIANVALCDYDDIRDIRIGDEIDSFKIEDYWHLFEAYQSGSVSLAEFLGEDVVKKIERILPERTWHPALQSASWFCFPDDNPKIYYNWETVKERLVDELETLLGGCLNARND